MTWVRGVSPWRQGEQGAGSLIALGVVAVLLGAGVVGVMWAAISVGRHRVAAAADLAALSAAQAVQSAVADPCTVAGQIAAEQNVTMQSCRVESEVVSVVVAVPVALGTLGTPVLRAEARAGPIFESGP